MNTRSITVAKYIGQQIERSGRLQEEIATDCGFANSNIISVIKNGVTKLPLAKVGVMSRALDVDAAYLLRLTMSEYMPEVWSVMESIFGRTSFVTTVELDLLGRLRQRAHGRQLARGAVHQAQLG
jgi:hypothetical protein